MEEIQSLDLEKIVVQKAKDAFCILKSPVLVEDISLRFNALGNLPGPLIRWFLDDLGNSGLCHLINHHKKDRSAVAEVAFCYYDGDDAKIFKAKARGKIASRPRGKRGFGWDPIFIPDGYKQTWAEMNSEDQNASSMRKIALRKLEQYLSNHK